MVQLHLRFAVSVRVRQQLSGREDVSRSHQAESKHKLQSFVFALSLPCFVLVSGARRQDKGSLTRSCPVLGADPSPHMHISQTTCCWGL